MTFTAIFDEWHHQQIDPAIIKSAKLILERQLKIAIDIARRNAIDRSVSARFVEGYAEDTKLASTNVDLVTAGQCWWWFDSKRVIAEVKRVLKPRGRLIIANFCYLPLDESVAARTEALILKHNPGWPKAGESGVFENQVCDLDAGGFHAVESISYTEAVTFTHEQWRGRMRACNGVGASMDSETVETFDNELSNLLKLCFREALNIPHRVFVVSGVK